MGLDNLYCGSLNLKNTKPGKVSPHLTTHPTNWLLYLCSRVFTSRVCSNLCTKHASHVFSSRDGSVPAKKIETSFWWALLRTSLHNSFDKCCRYKSKVRQSALAQDIYSSEWFTLQSTEQNIATLLDCPTSCVICSLRISMSYTIVRNDCLITLELHRRNFRRVKFFWNLHVQQCDFHKHQLSHAIGPKKAG